MDRRLLERRKRVAEDRARSNLGRLIRLLVLVAVLAALVWFAQSPFLSVAGIEVRGDAQVDVMAVLSDHQVVEGRPMLLVDVDGAEAALEQDPWVAEATVARDWPTDVVVEVTERRPAVSVDLGEWWLVAADATLLSAVDEPEPGLPRAAFPSLAAEAAADDLDLKGAVEYLTALPEVLRPEATVSRGSEGLEAAVAGYTVRLGGPFEMPEKAAVTVAVLEQGVEEGSIITVVAPASPAVLPASDGTAPTSTTLAPQP